MLKKIAAYFLSIVLLLLIGVASHASTPCFTVSAMKGCVPFTVTVDPSCAIYNPATNTPQYNYDYLTTPGNYSTTKTHIYTTPGTYRISQFIDLPSNNTFIDVQVFASPQPIFTVKSCVGKNVTVTITDPVYDKFDINWGDGSAVVTVLTGTTTSHTYTTDGFKSVSVTGKFLPNAACGSKTVSPYAITSLVIPDLSQLQVLSQNTTTGKIQINYQAILGQLYNIERSKNGGAYSVVSNMPIATTSSTVTFLDQNLDTQTKVYQYRVATHDDCGVNLYSDPIYSIIIKATPSNGFNTVTWNTNPTVNDFTFTKNTISQNFPKTTTNFPDNTIACGSTYCYSNTASLTTLTLSGTPQKSISIDTCIVAISTTIPPAPQNINSTLNGSNATISWTSAGSNSISYNLYQSVNAGAYTQLTQLTGTSYSYNVPNLNSSYCYQLDYTDLCGNPSPKSLTTCPVILEGAISGTTITLNWNAYIGYIPTGVQSYAVQKIDQNGNVLSEINMGGALTFSETVNLNDPYINYRIKVYPTSGLFTNSFSNNSLFKFEAEVFVPDIFTPNGDGTNDNFIVKGRYVNTYSISIFSRWGEVVYASTDMSVGWNGFNNFVYTPEGAYTYKIIATDINNKEFTKTGTVTLTR